jgi:hypothetical protein
MTRASLSSPTDSFALDKLVSTTYGTSSKRLNPIGLPKESCSNGTVYRAIEPDRLYVWKTAEVRRQKHTEQANPLFGRKPRKGSIHPEYRIWQGEKEPLFTSALDVIRKSLERYRQFEWDMEPFFQLQMAYMLL